MNARQLMETFGELTEADVARELAYKKPVIRHSGQRIAAISGMAACIAAVAGIGCLLQDDGLTQQSSNLEAMMQEVVTEPVQTAAEPAQTAPAVTAPPEEAPAVPAQTKTAPAVTEPAAEPTPTETEPAATEAPPAQTEPTRTQPPADLAPEQPAEPEPEQLVFEPGDVDMDGKITFVDAALVYIDTRLANYDRLDLSLLTDEQRALGNVDRQIGYQNHWVWDEEKQDYAVIGVEFPLNNSSYDMIPDETTGKSVTKKALGDDEIIFNVACYRNWLGLTGLTTDEYIADLDYYDHLYEQWFWQAAPEVQQHIQDIHQFYRELRLAVWKTKRQAEMEQNGETSIEWENNKWLPKGYLQVSVYMDNDVLYNADWFYEKAEEMRAYF